MRNSKVKISRHIQWLSFGLMGCVFTGCSAKPFSKTDIITACQQTVFGYAHSRDAVDLETNGNLFTENATLIIGEQVLSGREAIKAGLADRGPKNFARHIISSVEIKIDDEQNISGTSYALVYVGPPIAQVTLPVAVPQLTPKFIVTYQDEFSLSRQTCLIKNRQVIFDMIEASDE